MSILPLTIPPKKLAQTISASAMSFKLNNIQGWRGVDLVPGDFGTEAYGVFINSTRTQIEIFKFDPATIADASITILVRGLGYTGGDVEIPANKFPWASNDTTVQLGTDAPQLFRDFLSASNPATITALHEYNVLPQSAVVPVADEDFANKAYVDGLTSPAITVPITQVAHGFVAGDVIRISGVNTYTKAQANNAVNAEVVGIVIEVISPDIFRYVTEGVIETGVPVEAAGTVLFLSPTVAGALTAVEPTTIGHVSLPLAVVSESGVKMIFHKFRGAVLSTIAGNPIASETTAGIVEQATPAEVAAGTDVGTTGAPLFVVPSLLPSSDWELIESRTVTSGGEAFTDLDEYREIVVLLDEVTASAAVRRSLFWSIDNGVTWLDAYANSLGTSGQSSFVFSAGLSQPRTVYVHILNFNMAGVPKITDNSGSDAAYMSRVITETGALNAVRVTTAGGDLLTGGTIHLLGRK